MVDDGIAADEPAPDQAEAGLSDLPLNGAVNAGHREPTDRRRNVRRPIPTTASARHNCLMPAQFLDKRVLKRELCHATHSGNRSNYIGDLYAYRG
jgi:hypothetical protein